MKIFDEMLYSKAIVFGVILSAILFITSCNSEKGGKNLPLFQKLSSKRTNLTFENTLTESDTLNYFLYPYIYMGGGVSAGDFNCDGLTDLYLVGNMVPDRMYLNKGNFTFEDITEISNTGGGNRWKLGSTVCDINNDSLPDIYVCVSGLTTNRENLLFVNQGVNKDGIPVFKEDAKKYGINDAGMSTQSTFFDYDNDGDMDLYVANYPITPFKASPYVYKQMMRNVKWIDSGHLYRNNGDGTFTDVTRESGLLAYGLTLSATVGDFNQDGFKDLYISNDFTCPDYFFFNNGDGTFSDKAGEVLGQTSFYGMGVDVADYNNDGLLDIMQIDMAPEDNKRAKMNMSSMLPEDFDDMVNQGLHHQYRYSTLNLNRGILKNNLPFFSNAAWLAGVTSTDWSWAALFADFDLDGWKDLYITNGSRRDMNDADYFNKISKSDYFSKSSNNAEMLKQAINMPSKPLPDYIFRNNGDLTFTRYNEQWDITEPSYSNGVAYADLDNDGDLDLIENNIDQEAFIYKNNASESKSGNYLKIKFNGTSKNKFGIGSVVSIWNGGKIQMAELTLSRGYESSVEPILYFGLANNEFIDSLSVKWNDGKIQNMKNVRANQKLTLKHSDAISIVSQKKTFEKIFKEITDTIELEFDHKENSFDDYKSQVLLPYKLSQLGPCIAVGDSNNDNLDDFFIGNASGSSGKMFIQNKDGTFRVQSGPWEQDIIYEDEGCLFFDADNDRDLDLFVVSGGNEFPEGSEN
jgi:enediyne biosynthesis protein E4